MGDRFIHSGISSLYSSRSLPYWQVFDRPFAKRSCDTPLSPSHAGDKGSIFKAAGLRPVDMVVLPRPSTMEEGKAAVSVPSKRLSKEAG
jgi:hypothetical protein